MNSCFGCKLTTWLINSAQIRIANVMSMNRTGESVAGVHLRRISRGSPAAALRDPSARRRQIRGQRTPLWIRAGPVLRRRRQTARCGIALQPQRPRPSRKRSRQHLLRPDLRASGAVGSSRFLQRFRSGFVSDRSGPGPSHPRRLGQPPFHPEGASWFERVHADQPRHVPHRFYAR